MKKDILIILIVFIAVLGLVLYAQTKTDKVLEAPKLLKPKDTEETTLEQKNTSVTLVEAPTQASTLSVVDKNQSTQNDRPTNYVLYETITKEEATLMTKSRLNVPHVSAVKLHSSIRQNLQKDSTIQLPDIEGIDYDITITYTKTNNDGSISATGNFMDENIKYTTTITTSDDNTFITLVTPRGAYEIETNSAIGYIYRTDAIRKHLFYPTKSDAIILPIPSPPPTSH